MKPIATVTPKQMALIKKYQAQPTTDLLNANFGEVSTLLRLIGAPQNKYFDFEKLPYKIIVHEIYCPTCCEPIDKECLDCNKVFEGE